MMSRRAQRLLGIYAALVCIFSVSPVLIIVAESITETDYVVFPPVGFTLHWYFEIAKRPAFIDSAIVSLVVAIGASVISTILGTLAAIALVRYTFFGRDLLRSLFLAPLSLPGLILGLALLQFFVAYGVQRNIPALIIGHIIITMPFTIRFVTVALVGLDPNVELAARSLGANPWNAFRRVTLPLVRPGVVAGAVFAFILSFDDVTVALFLSGPAATTLPVRIYTYIDQNYDPLVTAVSSILVLTAGVMLIAVERTVGVGRLFGLRHTS